MPVGIYKRIKGKKRKPLSENIKKKIRESNKGKKKSKETKIKMSLGRLNSEKIRGKNHYNWKGGITPFNKIIRRSFKYRQWVSDVFTRDNYTCQTCGKRGCYLETHHIKALSLILKENNIKNIEDAEICAELWNINNGITLCLECHKLTDNYKGKSNIKY